jgi:hypothetical protein
MKKRFLTLALAGMFTSTTVTAASDQVEGITTGQFALGMIAIAAIAAIISISVVLYHKPRLPDLRMFGYLLVPIVLILGLGLLLRTSVFERNYEIQLGFLVVIAIIALITLLFIVAAGFSQLKLTDPNQALGLPEGSIRAMIALMLILVFIIFGIFVFRLTANGNEAGPIQMTLTELNAATNVSSIAPVTEKDEKGNDKIIEGKYDVWRRSDLTADAVRLATQLLTTVGTLVVAVAGFYFGRSSVSSAVAAVRGTTTQPTIAAVTPVEGKQNEEISLTITGRNFQIPRSVRLTRAAEEIVATDVMVNAGKITAKVKLDKPPEGANWDVVVQNEDGSEVRLEKAFKITPK